MRGGHSATRIVVWLILVYYTQLLALVYSPILTNIKMTNLLYPHIISQQFIKKIYIILLEKCYIHNIFIINIKW